MLIHFRVKTKRSRMDQHLKNILYICKNPGVA